MTNDKVFRKVVRYFGDVMETLVFDFELSDEFVLSYCALRGLEVFNITEEYVSEGDI